MKNSPITEWKDRQNSMNKYNFEIYLLARQFRLLGQKF
jgi:hypothetical protein